MLENRRVTFVVAGLLLLSNLFLWPVAFQHGGSRHGGAAAAGVDPSPAPGATQDPVKDVARSVGIAKTIRSWSVAIADLQGDKRPDLLIGRHSEDAPLLFMSNAKGGFDAAPNPLPAGVDRHGCAWADVDRNGLLDVYCAAGADRGTAAVKANELWMQTKPGTFVEKAEAYGVTDPTGRGRWPVFLDVNHDHYVDLFLSNASPRTDGKPSPNRLFLNAGGKAFTAAPEMGLDSEVGGACASAVDFDKDGWTDLLVCGNVHSARGGLRLYRNEKGKAFADVTKQLGISGDAQDALLADMDADGDLDLVRVQQGAVLAQAQENGAFGPEVTIRELAEKGGRSLAVGDINGDHIQDLYVVQGCADNNSHPPNSPDLLLLGTGLPGEFSDVAPPTTTKGCGDWVFSLDYDLDGRTDFLVLNGCCEGPEGLPVGPVQLLTSPTTAG